MYRFNLYKVGTDSSALFPLGDVTSRMNKQLMNSRYSVNPE